MRWERLEEGDERQDFGGEISGPGKRWGHTCNAIKEGRFLYVFGGYGRLNSQTNQVHAFDTVTQKWCQPVIKGTPPTPRDSHSCTTVGDNLYVFGGTDGMRPLKDLFILDTSSHTWIQPSVRGEGPEAREGHSAAVVGKRLFVFGGCGKSLSNEEIYYNDLYILNTETFVWKRAITSGTPPSPRDSHTCSSWKNNLIVIGGEDGHDYYLADVHILDTDTLVWRELNTSGFLLTPRAGHCTVSFGKKLFVFGGFTDAQNLYNDLYMLDIDTAVWTKIVTVGDGPSARFSVAGDCLDPQRRGVLMFLGGCNKSLEALDDMHYLYTGISREVDDRLDKLSLRKQLKLKCQEQSLTPIQGHPFVGAGLNIYQPMNVPVYGQSYFQNVSFIQHPPQHGKKTFQARVTERISDGYTIETIIDGKPLRGVLFSNRQSISQTATLNPIRKRAAEETQGTVTNGDYSTHEKPGKVLKTDFEEPKQAASALAKEPTANEPMADEPTTDEPMADEPTADEPTADEPTADEPTADEPTADEPTADEPMADEPTADEPMADEPTVDEPTVDEPTADEPTADEPTADEPTADEPTADEPTAYEPTADEPTADEPTADEPTADEPTADEPTADEPTADEPMADEPKAEGVDVLLKDQTSCETPQTHEVIANPITPNTENEHSNEVTKSDPEVTEPDKTKSTATNGDSQEPKETNDNSMTFEQVVDRTLGSEL